MPSLTPTPGLTPFPPIYTPGPTFSPAEEEAYWLELISTNGGCELPCWSGISPGKSEEKELLVFYKPWGLTKWYPWPTSDALETEDYPLHVNQDGILNLAVTTRLEKGIVQSIFVLADNLLDFSLFSKVMQRYSLRNVFLKQGIPSRISLDMLSGPRERSAPWTYTMWVFYDQQGILLIYEGEGLTRSGNIIQVCPDYEKVNDIRFYLQPAESNIPLERLVGSDFDPKWFETYSIQETTGLSLKDFYNKFVNSTQRVCFDTSASLWP